MSSSRGDLTFDPISPNPFIVGNPVRDPTMFFGRQDEFELVKTRFQASEHGGLLIFCGERRSGKTSILFQILDGRLGPQFIPVLIDMQSMAIQNEADFLDKIAREIRRRVDPEGKSFEIPDFAQASNAAAAFHDFVDRVLGRDPTRKPILLFDEYELLETKIDSGVLEPDVLHILSHLMEHYSVFMVFTGSEHLEQRRRDYWRFLGKAIHKRISYLSHRDALSLMTAPVEGRVRYEPDVLEGIFRLTAGQPFYTQGICQVLVDSLNDRRTREATGEILQEVVEHLLENPFPQMLFLWDAFDQDEKLVLALLAEALEEPEDHATPKDLQRLMARRSYPLALKEVDIATALEGLFKKEFLLRNHATPAGFAFRMDLWRLWTRRMHSVWQVIRELGLSRRQSKKIRIGPWQIDARVAMASVATLVLLFGGYWITTSSRWPGMGGEGPHRGVLPGTPPDAIVQILVLPEDAGIHRDGQLVARARYPLRLSQGESSLISVRLDGFADSTFTVAWNDSGACAGSATPCITAQSGGNPPLDVALRALLGSVRIRVEPASATIVVDGETRGRGEVQVDGLLVPEPHAVLVEAPGYAPRTLSFQVEEVQVNVLPSIVLQRLTSMVTIITSPPGANVRVGEEGGRRSPDVWNLTHESHRVRLALAGYAPRDTTIMITGPQRISIELEELANGAIRIWGERLADIWIEQEQVCRENRTSQVRSYAPGTYTYRIYIAGNEDPLEGTLEVRAGELVDLYYTTGRVERKAWSEEG